MGFFRQQDQKLEDRLRSLSAEPREEFVRELSTEIRTSRVRTTVRSRRVLAAALTTAALMVPFAAFGGIGYAAQAAKNAAQSVSGGGTSAKSNTNNGNAHSSATTPGASADSTAGPNGASSSASNTPSDDEYKPGWGCGDKNHIHTGPPGNPGADSPCD